MTLTPPLTVEARKLEGWLDGDLICSYGGPPYERDDCPNPVRWRAVLPCRHVWLYCHDHKERSGYKDEDGWGGIECPCGKSFDPERITWIPL